MDWQSQLPTLYPLGILDKKHEIKMLYDHADRYWRDWFPHLPSCGAYAQRLNRLADVFLALLERRIPAGSTPALPESSISFP